MVVYNLICKKNHQFEGWFPSFEDFQKQADTKADLMSDMRQQAGREDAPCLRRPRQKGTADSSEKGRATGGDASDTAIAR